MKEEKYYPPKRNEEQYNCIYCGVFAKQFWADIRVEYLKRYYSYEVIGEKTREEELGKEWAISKCQHCKEKIFWLDDEIIYPKKISVEKPNDDLTEDIKKDYYEAARIFKDSPRSSAALLRLAVQKLLKQLGEKGENINHDIGSLVKKGVDQEIQQCLDIVRVFGNNAVHPGIINLEEKRDLVLDLFKIINKIATKMLTAPKKHDVFYKSLGPTALEAIENRDQAK